MLALFYKACLERDIEAVAVPSRNASAADLTEIQQMLTFSRAVLSSDVFRLGEGHVPAS